ncbi:hypothetical protein O3G_MSEX009881 [Manduca sexta]|uniref:Uncharacterized protein n=1 Tax=Manduca sexta TaxID=7130 RepID=A0A922CSX9_MANSE|nr:hypothetical protein O3G_MSEX009881 [Manduca sexta]
MLIILCIIQVAIARNLEKDLKKPRHNYMQEPSLMPADLDYSSLFPSDYKPQLPDEILAVLHDENTDSNFDKTKKDQPSRLNFAKWFEDAMSNKKPTVVKEVKPNCTEQKLEDIIHHLSILNDNIEELKTIMKSNNAYLVMKVPNRPKQRRKRDVNSTKVDNDVKTDNKTEGGRRYMSIVDTPNDVKTKLLFYLDEAFKEIDKKIEPLNILKKTYVDNNYFKIGYIVANIDTLEINLKKLKDEMDENKHLWDDRKVLELFDRLKASDNVLTSLLDSVKLYVDMKNVY